MRCEDVIRELAAPSGTPDPATLADHLARCPRCASWSDRDAKLGRLWEATRPPGPSPGAWESIWSRASEALDHPRPIPAPAPSRRFPSRRAAIAAFGIAQAAAVLVAVLAWPRPQNQPNPIQIAQNVAPVVQPPFVPGPSGPIDIPEGQTVMISVDRKVVEVCDLSPSDGTNTIDANWAIYNAIEPLDPVKLAIMQ